MEGLVQQAHKALMDQLVLLEQLEGVDPLDLLVQLEEPAALVPQDPLD